VVPLARPWPILVSGVRRFWEKPRPKVAAALQARGCLWNSFLIVAPRVSALVGLVRQALPAVYGTLASARPAFDGPREYADVRDAYAFLPSADFSREVLAVRPERLGVLPVSGVTWNDLGDPARVFATRRQVEHWASVARPVAVGQ
jgi:mannose-1-phosphate guanylyltransferase